MYISVTKWGVWTAGEEKKETQESEGKEGEISKLTNGVLTTSLQRHNDTYFTIQENLLVQIWVPQVLPPPFLVPTKLI